MVLSSRWTDAYTLGNNSDDPESSATYYRRISSVNINGTNEDPVENIDDHLSVLPIEKADKKIENNSEQRNGNNRFRRTTLLQSGQTNVNNTINNRNETENMNTRKNFVMNAPVQNNSTVNSGNATENMSTRRYFVTNPPVHNVIRDKLVVFADESLDNVRRKVKNLVMLKDSLINNPIYKIGYIVANIDILTVNLDNLKEDMEKNKEFWDDMKVLDVFDKLKAADSVVSRLFESLKVFVDI